MVISCTSFSVVVVTDGLVSGSSVTRSFSVVSLIELLSLGATVIGE